MLRVVDVSKANPVEWEFDTVEHLLLEPQLWWEGGNLTISRPWPGASGSITRHIRDPNIFYDKLGVLRLAYCGGGEYAIGVANITCTS